MDGLRIASGATACFSVTIQIWKNYKTKSSKDISHGLILLSYISTSLGISYGIYLDKPAIYGSNFALLGTYLILHGVKIYNDYSVNDHSVEV
jgi:uncharacterized protein with PQ loop repeat